MIYVTPVGPYFKGGMRAIELLISDEFHRAAPADLVVSKRLGTMRPA